MMHLSKISPPQTQVPYHVGVLVADVANLDRHGRVLKAGPEASEIRFEDGTERAIPNKHLRAISRPDELAKPTHTEEPPEDAAVRQGQEAWRRLRDNSTWADWKKLGAAHVVGRAAAMRDAHINKPKGRSYNAVFGAWQKQFGFETLDKSDRARLFDVMDHLADIEAWLETLKPTERLRLNHPNSVWRRWKTATAKPGTEPKVSAVQKLKDSIVTIEEENTRLKRELAHGGGDPWTPEDNPQEIARVMFGKLSKTKAEKVAREILRMVKEASNAQ